MLIAMRVQKVSDLADVSYQQGRGQEGMGQRRYEATGGSVQKEGAPRVKVPSGIGSWWSTVWWCHVCDLDAFAKSSTSSRMLQNNLEENPSDVSK